jgi:UDP-N-acetylglucosamine transferase subunit ALG13
VNEELMDNHQTELADALSSRGHLVSALPDSLYDALSDPCLENPKPWHEPKPEVFAWVCNELMSQQSS